MNYIVMYSSEINIQDGSPVLGHLHIAKDREIHIYSLLEVRLFWANPGINHGKREPQKILPADRDHILILLAHGIYSVAI